MNITTISAHPDIIVFDAGAKFLVNLKDEIDDKSRIIKRYCILSGELKCVVIAECNAKIHEKSFNSAIVCDCGHLLGISDMTYDLSGKYDTGAYLSVYETSAGKIGIIIGDDIMLPDTEKRLKDMGAQQIIIL